MTMNKKEEEEEEGEEIFSFPSLVGDGFAVPSVSHSLGEQDCKSLHPTPQRTPRY